MVQCDVMSCDAMSCHVMSCHVCLPHLKVYKVLLPCRYTDPLHVKMKKIELLSEICMFESAREVLGELR